MTGRTRFLRIAVAGGAAGFARSLGRSGDRCLRVDAAVTAAALWAPPVPAMVVDQPWGRSLAATRLESAPAEPTAGPPAEPGMSSGRARAARTPPATDDASAGRTRGRTARDRDRLPDDHHRARRRPAADVFGSAGSSPRRTSRVGGTGAELPSGDRVDSGRLRHWAGVVPHRVPALGAGTRSAPVPDHRSARTVVRLPSAGSGIDAFTAFAGRVADQVGAAVSPGSGGVPGAGPRVTDAALRTLADGFAPDHPAAGAAGRSRSGHDVATGSGAEPDGPGASAGPPAPAGPATRPGQAGRSGQTSPRPAGRLTRWIDDQGLSRPMRPSRPSLSAAADAVVGEAKPDAASRGDMAVGIAADARAGAVGPTPSGGLAHPDAATTAGTGVEPTTLDVPESYDHVLPADHSASVSAPNVVGGQTPAGRQDAWHAAGTLDAAEFEHVLGEVLADAARRHGIEA